MDIWYRRDSGLEPLISRIQSEGFDTEGMDVPGRVVPVIGRTVRWGNVIGNITDQKDLKKILDYLQKEIEEGSGSGKVFVYKGQVPTYNDLPKTDNKVGDVWDVADTGNNYVWNGEDWDNLSTSVDLSEYAKIEYVDDLINNLSIALQTDIQDLEDKKADTSYVIELNNSVVDGVNAEINARKAADTTLQNNINKVAEDLQRHIEEAEDDFVTREDFNQEVLDRQNADTTLQGNIDTLNNVVEGLSENSATKSELNDETNARMASDNLLDDRLDVLENKDFVEYKDISNPENPNRKAIILDNHDGIFGKDTEGNIRTLGMISKYNVADFGNPHLHTNLNTQQIVTVNDNQAVLTDKNMDQVILAGDNVIIDKETKVDPTTGFEFQTLTINAELSGTDHRIDELAANLDQETQARTEKDTALENKFNNYMDIETTANYVTGEIDNLANTVSQLYVGKSEIYDNYLVDYYQKTETYSKDQVDELIQDIDAGQLRADLDQEIQDRQTADEALDTRIEALEAKTEAIFHYKGTVATIAELPQNAEIGDVYNVEETGSNYAWTGTEWDKLSETIDLTPYDLKADREAAINTLSNTLQGEIDLKANQTDLTELQENVDESLAHQDGNIQALLLQMEDLRKRIEDVKSLDPEVIVLYDGSDTEFTNKEKDFQLSGNVTASTSIAGSSVTLKDLTLSAAAMTMLASDDVTVKNLTMDGTLPKKVSNYIVGIHADDYVAIRDSVLNPENAYNGIEIGLTTGLAKSVTIDNVDFAGHLSNNAINVFGLADYGVLTISNCHFNEVSNILRLSNRANTIWTVNIINCTFDSWETGEYGGMILLQDYTSKSEQEAIEGNQFHNLIINIQNCTKPDGTKITAPENMVDICATGDENQLIYMYDGWRGIVPYSADIYPTINIR